VAEFYKGKIPIIDFDGGRTDLSHPKGVGYGYVPRDYSEFPEEMFAPPSQMQLIPESEWDARYDEQEENESSLEHIFLRGGKPAFVNLDQNGDGDCWAYSNGSAKMLADLRDGKPVRRLNPHFIATYLKRYNGGWCGAGAQVLFGIGCLEEGRGAEEWPLHSHDTRLMTQARIAAAAKHKSKEEWRDLTRQIYDQEMTTLQLATCGFNNIPAPSDFDWQSHSVCQVRWVRIERGSWGPLILNSWKGWGRYGLGVYRGRQAIADGAVAICY
jgi:hypothetical protein